MFIVPAGTVIQVQVPKSQQYYYWSGWRPYTTPVVKLYDKEDVWDIVAVHNGRADIPEWARRNIVEFNKIVIRAKGKFALINPKDIHYLD